LKSKELFKEKKGSPHGNWKETTWGAGVNTTGCPPLNQNLFHHFDCGAILEFPARKSEKPVTEQSHVIVFLNIPEDVQRMTVGPGPIAEDVLTPDPTLNFNENLFIGPSEV
jgi:hypothetical protein